MPVHDWTKVDVGIFHGFHLSWISGLQRALNNEPVAVGDELPPMPLFLTTEEYVPVPLEATYRAAWEALPDFWRDVVAAGP